jgi:autotransporter-associated beta strand protein
MKRIPHTTTVPIAFFSTRITNLKKIWIRLTASMVASCGIFAATAAFGQSSFIWTNQNPTFPTGGNLGIAANWTNEITGLNGLANPATPDSIEWNGSTVGNLALTLSGGFNGNPGNFGIRFYMNSNQISNLQIGPPAGVNGSLPRADSILIDAGAGQFVLGDDTTSTLEIVWGLAGNIHVLENNSTQTAIVKPNILWRMGGAGFHQYDFRGTGNWILNSYLRSDNSAASGLVKDGTGTLFWTGTNTYAYTAQPLPSGFVILGGTVVYKTFDLYTTSPIQNDNAGLGGTMLIYDAPLTNTSSSIGGPATWSGTISGFGPIRINQGKLTLSGANTYSGSNYLAGGELVANRIENVGVSGPLGQGGIISFAGGFLGYSAANSFDYSPRFDTTAGQAYKIDVPSGLTVHFATGLNSSGATLNLIGGGTLSLDGANTYSGLTTVSAGTLAIQGTKTGAGNITVVDGAALSVFENGTQVTPGTLTLGTNSGANVQFNNVNSGTAPVAPTTVSSTGTQTIDILSGTFSTIGQIFPLITWTSGSAPAVSLGIKNGFDGFLSTNVNTIQLTITETPYVWTGLNNNIWDTNTANNWVQSAVSKTFTNGVLAVFDDTSAVTNVSIAGLVAPRTLTFNSTNAYSVTNSVGNSISGGTGLTKNGNGTLLLPGGANTYTGVTMVNAGILSVSTLANGGSASDIGAASSVASNIVLNGGTLQYIGADGSVDRLFSVGTGGGTIDGSGSGPLTLVNSGTVGLNGSGSHSLTLRGTSSNTLTANIVDGSGQTALTKNDSGDWVLLGNNTYSGGTAINGGVVEVGTNGPNGAIGSGNILNNGNIRFNRTGTLTVNGAITGGGSVTNDGTGTVILANNNTYGGLTVINAGTLQVGNAGASGKLNANANVINNGLLIFNSTSSSLYGGSGIHGTGNVRIQRGTVKAVGGNDYTGWTQIDSGATFIPTDNNNGNAGTLTTSVITNNGTFMMEGYLTRTPMYANIVGTGKVQVGGTGPIFDAGDQVLAGTNNTYTGGTFIGETHLVLGDGFTPGSGSITGNVTFVNNFEDANDGVRRLIFNRPAGDDFVFSGTIATNFTSPQNNQGIVQQNGGNMITFTANNTYASGTVINSGTIQVGNGGTTGAIGTGNVTDNGLLIWNRSNDAALRGTITGVGSVVKMGAGSLTLNGVINYSGPTVVSNGTLVVAGAANTGIVAVGGDLSVEGGTVISGGTGLVVSNNVAGNMFIDSGTVVATLNRAGPISNTTYSVTGLLNATGGSLKLYNAGPLLHVGDKFFIFNQPVVGGATMTIVSPSFTVQNDLAVDGSVTVTSAQPSAPAITMTQSGTNLILSWPSAWIGAVHLQGQTNTLAIGLNNNWVTIPGTDLGNSYTNPIAKSTNRAVFFRLISP